MNTVNLINPNQLTLSPPLGNRGAGILKFVDYDIVFQEIPNEVTLAINLSNCPHRCKGCHSPQLQQNIGKELTETVLFDLLSQYEKSITCVCFMGGDATPDEVCRLAGLIRTRSGGKIKTAWYSGCEVLNTNKAVDNFNYVKLGAYIERFGGLKNPTTNQRLFRISNGRCENITKTMWKR